MGFLLVFFWLVSIFTIIALPVWKSIMILIILNSAIFAINLNCLKK